MVARQLSRAGCAASRAFPDAASRFALLRMRRNAVSGGQRRRAAIPACSSPLSAEPGVHQGQERDDERPPGRGGYWARPGTRPLTLAWSRNRPWPRISRAAG